MEPTSLSASALQTYMDCPAQYKVKYIDRVSISQGGGTAGDLGSLIHATLEWFINEGANPLDAAVLAKLRELAPNYGVDGLQIKVAARMVEAWLDRWNDHNSSIPFQVIQAEIKENFLLKVKDRHGVPHQIGVTYIWDRVDRLLQDGSIRVVDYKSWMKCLTGDEIHQSLQCRIYALAAAIKYKAEDPPYIWVQLDQLRYGLGTAVRFSKDDIRDIWGWLKSTYLAILNDDGTREVVGNGCRWCPRSISCVSFNAAVRAGTVMSYDGPEDAARKVAEINAVLGALKDTKEFLLAYLEPYLEERGYLEERWEGSGVTVKITPKNNRTVDQDAAAHAVGTELAARHGKLALSTIDDLLAGDELDDEQKAMLRKAITPGITTSINAQFK